MTNQIYRSFNNDNIQGKNRNFDSFGQIDLKINDSQQNTNNRQSNNNSSIDVHNITQLVLSGKRLNESREATERIKINDEQEDQQELLMQESPVEPDNFEEKLNNQDAKEIENVGEAEEIEGQKQEADGAPDDLIA